MENIISEYYDTAKKHGLELCSYVNDNVPKTIYTDSTRLNQILSNLISNAIKYSSSGTITLELNYDEENQGILFSVRDEGNGIKKDEINNLFQQYCQTSSSERTISNGLGLCISQKIAKLLGGKITVLSEYQKGSMFTLFHPTKLGQSGVFEFHSKLRGNLSGNILLVDDNISNTTLLRLLIETLMHESSCYFNIQTAKDGKDAIDYVLANINIKETKPDIIFMDINMGGIDGCTASKIIRENNFDGLIVATTGNIMAKKENRKNKEECDKYQYFDDVIIKPYDNTAIIKILNQLN